MTYEMALGEDFSIVTKDGGTIVVPAIVNSPLFDPLSAYSIGDKAYDGNDQYACISAVSAPTSGQSNPMPSVDPLHWELSPAKIAVDDYTKLQNMPQINDVTLSGNKTATDLGLATQADATLTERVFSAWACSPADVDGVTVVMKQMTDGSWYPSKGSTSFGVLKGNAQSTSLSWTANEWWGEVPLTATRTVLSGYQLGSQDDKPLASEAEAEALRTGKLDKSGGTMTGTLDFGDFSPIINRISLLDLTPDKTFYCGDSIITNGPAGPNGRPSYVYIRNLQNKSGTFAFLENIAPAFSTYATYAPNALCVHEGVLYRCTTAITTAEAWTPAHWTAATVEDLLAALRMSKANESDLHYSFATKDLSNGIVTLDDRASNCTETSASTLSVAFPSQIDGKARNFAWILDATGQTAPSITFTDYIALLVDGSADLTPQLGTNMYKFAEISKNKFFTSHRMLSTAIANQPASTESLFAAMSAQGIDTSSIATPGDVTTALSIGQDATFQDCIDAAIYG